MVVLVSLGVGGGQHGDAGCFNHRIKPDIRGRLPHLSLFLPKSGMPGQASGKAPSLTFRGQTPIKPPVCGQPGFRGISDKEWSGGMGAFP